MDFINYDNPADKYDFFFEVALYKRGYYIMSLQSFNEYLHGLNAAKRADASLAVKFHDMLQVMRVTHITWLGSPFVKIESLK